MAESPPQDSLAWRAVMAFLWALPVLASIDFLLSAYGRYHVLSPDNYAMFWDRRGLLYTHLAGGLVTVVLGPVQLLMQTVVTSRPTHRWIGRVYLLGLLVACAGAAGLIATSPAPMQIRVAFAATMLAWLATASVALRAIRRGQVLVHRKWMIRCYLVTLAPVAFRLTLKGVVAAGVAPSPDLVAALLVLSWAVPLIVYRLLDRITIPGRQGGAVQHGVQTRTAG